MDAVMSTGIETETSEEAGPQLYDVTQDTIDVYAENRQPNARDFSLVWDKSLFYTLEDVTAEDTDGQIEKYDVFKKELLNGVNGNQIEYEIYTNPETGKMNKIVSIEHQGDSLLLTDYYYLDNGQPNFIYQRTDSIYTPTYATPDKTGERFYFNNDTLVKWRWINVPLQVEELSLVIDEQSSAQAKYVYNDAGQDKQNEYDAKEIQMLNAAYNTYAAVEKSADYGNVKGYVSDADHVPLQNANITFFAGTEPVGSITTDENGYYETGISLYEGGYRVEVSCEGYKAVTIYDVSVNAKNVTTWLENVCLVAEETTEHSVWLNIYDGDTVSYDDNAAVIRNGIAGASVIVREGIRNTSGDSMAESTSDDAGSVNLELSAGVYTLEISIDGYSRNYETLIVDGDKTVDIPLVQEITGDQIKVVLSWNGDADLDSCLFTPHKAESGDMARINAVNSTDDYGNILTADSKDGQTAEVITIANRINGTYKYYVSDYNNCLNGNYTATDMLTYDIRVTVYDKNGIVAVYTIPRNLRGVIWEVFEIKNGKVVTLQNSYANLDGNNWWSEDKSVKKKISEVYVGYREYLEKYDEGADDNFALVYLNNDEIPELVIYDAYLMSIKLVVFNDSTGMAEMAVESQTYNNKVTYEECMLGGGGGSAEEFYIEKENLICVSNQNCFYRYDIIYTLDNTEVKKIKEGAGELIEGEYDKYTWSLDQVEVSESEYNEEINKVFDFSRAISFWHVDYKNKKDMITWLDKQYCKS